MVHWALRIVDIMFVPARLEDLMCIVRRIKHTGHTALKLRNS